MKFDLKVPCRECPFRQDIHPYLHPERAREIGRAVLHDGKTFACHKSVYPSRRKFRLERNKTKHSMCAGALLFIERAAPFGNQMVQIAERLGLYDPSILKRDKVQVHESLDDFVKHHGGRTGQ